jgi:NitT/TauT family transport system substrate-binding protein
MRKKSKGLKRLSIILALAMTASLFAGCSSGTSSTGSASAGSTTASGSPQKVTLQLKWLPQSQFMGYYIAEEKGYYKDEGIDINILPGGSDIIPEQQVSNGVADIGVTWTSSLMKYQEKGWDLKEVAQVFQKSAMLLVSKKSSNINSVADFKGKNIGSWFGGNEYELYALLGKYNLNKDKDIKLVQQDFTMNQLESGKVDVAQAMTYNEYGLLLEAGYTDATLNKIDVNDEGVAMLEDCLFSNSDWLSKNPDLMAKFLKASIKGWQDACADPEAAGKIVYEKNKSVSLAHQTYMAKEVAKLVVPSGFDKTQIGYMDPAAIKQTADLGLKYGLLTKAADTANTIDDSYWKKAVGK